MQIFYIFYLIHLPIFDIDPIPSYDSSPYNNNDDDENIIQSVAEALVADVSVVSVERDGEMG
jgi:hypothetical protein